MKKHIHSYTLLFSIIILSTLLLGSCTHILYAPNVQNVPAFTEGNQLQIKGFTTDEFPTNFEAQSAYSVTNHIAVMANGAFFNDDDLGKGNVLELGAGLFTSPYPDFTLELYGGGGNRTTTFTYHEQIEPETQTTFNFTRYFAQGAMAWHHEYGTIALSTRVSQLNFVNYTTNNPNSQHDKYLEDMQNIQLSANDIFIEPALTLKLGNQQFNVQLQIQSSVNMNQGVHDVIPSDHLTISGGACINISTRKKINP